MQLVLSPASDSFQVKERKKRVEECEMMGRKNYKMQLYKRGLTDASAGFSFLLRSLLNIFIPIIGE